ncbi:hypothetical protein [Runella slithyformis]|nr:hypothetical protein [Runella slithyformis]
MLSEIYQGMVNDGRNGLCGGAQWYWETRSTHSRQRNGGLSG